MEGGRGGRERRLSLGRPRSPPSADSVVTAQVTQSKKLISMKELMRPPILHVHVQPTPPQHPRHRVRSDAHT